MERGNRVWCPKVLKKKRLRSGAHTGKKVFSSLSVSQKKISSQQNIWVFSSQGMSPSIIFSILMNQNQKEEGHIIIHDVFFFNVVPDSRFFHFGCLLPCCCLPSAQSHVKLYYLSSEQVLQTE